MVEFGQFVIGGLGFGAIYALAALGLVLIFKTTGVVNFASGAMATVATLILWTALTVAGLPLIAAWLCAMAAALVIGAVTEALFMRRVEGMPVLIQIVVTLGLLLLLDGLAAILVAPTVSLSPTMMDDIAVYAFAAAVLGGFGSLAGAIVGGFVIGVVNSLIGAYLSTNYQLSLVFLLIVVILYVRPQGLFGVEATTRQ